MKKRLDIYCLHPRVHDAESMIAFYQFEPFLDQYEFVWNPQHPSYLFVPEQIYTHKAIFNEFLKIWRPVRNYDCVYIQFLTETIKPDLNLFDYGVCWDENFSIPGRTVRILPTKVWMSSFRPKDFSPVKSLEEARAILERKTKFCNFMYSHADQERDNLFHAIMKYKHVDALGRRFHNTDFKPTGFPGHRQETSTLREPYKFTIAGENGEYLGYTSEKIWTAFWGHSIPIYWGNPHVEEDVNGCAFIHARRYESEAALLERIRQVDEDDELWCRMLCEPFQTLSQVQRDKEQEQHYYAFFEQIFSVSVLQAKRLERAAETEIYQNWFRQSSPSKRPLMERIKRKLNLVMQK